MQAPVVTEDFTTHMFVVTSIILGLGITEILSGVGSYLRNRGRIEISWPLAMWVGLTFVAIIQAWWAVASYNYTNANFFLYSTRILADTAFFLLARMVLPDFSSPDVAKYFEKDEAGEFLRGPEYSYRLRGYYWRNVATLSAIAISVVALVSLQEYLQNVRGGPGVTPEFRGKMDVRMAFLGLLTLIGVTGWYHEGKIPKHSRWEWAHSVVILVFGVALAYFIRTFSFHPA